MPRRLAVMLGAVASLGIGMALLGGGSPVVGRTQEDASNGPVASEQAGTDSWPSVECSGGLTKFESRTRRVSACVPQRMEIVEHEYGPVEGTIGKRLSITFQEPLGPSGFVDSYVSLQIIDKRSADERANLETTCPNTTDARILEYQVEQCVWSESSPNGAINGEGGLSWGIHRFAEATDYWVVADAAGTQTGAEQAAAIELALIVLDSFEANGLAQVAEQPGPPDTGTGFSSDRHGIADYAFIAGGITLIGLGLFLLTRSRPRSVR